MPCMKRPFNTERQALANQRRINKRRGRGRTEQQAYPCPDCSADGPTTWHLRTETELPAAKVRGIRRHRPAAQAWQDEDYEGNWAA
ncbi:hypothetical protein SEA_VIBAKI_70 [Arthrobacter phage Vibaki]|uniref:Uncharacterized protein n=1 Tax=Arthrobacter phage Vibaki TaxID=2593333 RepID=A0A514TZ69_9CAUD|nr:hypothetical protein HYP95_gp70 [Arthrobacter phage Vibaki]QDK01950.1 hypothetical protein SEA_VIBAKI_70 [Arthrobacter phage Vibaki]